MTTWRILVVDDELLYLHMIADDLSGGDYVLETALNGEAALEKLRADPAFDLIILDRIMPGLDGIEFLNIIKADPDLQAIPVVMQTAASSPEEVAEGIAAGAYYYLVKPYDSRSMQGIVRAALLDKLERDLLVSQSRSYGKCLQLLSHAEFRLSDLEEAQGLAQMLGGLCPDSSSVTMGLAELLINAIEHGNLGITYEEKKRLRQEGNWEEEVFFRGRQPDLCERVVTVSMERKGDVLQFRITDQGEGFDSQPYLTFDPLRAGDPNGRGIAMARMLAFASLDYEEGGRTAVATVKLD